MLEAQAKNQGHKRKCSPKKEKKGFPKIFLGGKKGLQNIFSGNLQKKEEVFANFPQGFWRFPTKFQGSKNNAVLKPRTEQFSRT